MPAESTTPIAGAWCGSLCGLWKWHVLQKKKNGAWQELSWETCITVAVDRAVDCVEPPRSEFCAGLIFCWNFVRVVDDEHIERGLFFFKYQAELLPKRVKQAGSRVGLAVWQRSRKCAAG